jgi:hypothetical protein
MSPKTVCVVSCTAHKREQPMRAENLYCSDLFYKSRRYAQANHDSWLILSAKYGLLHPSEIIQPYDLNLAALARKERLLLADQVSKQFSRLVDADKTSVSSLCGENYENLLDQAGIQYRAAVLLAGDQPGVAQHVEVLHHRRQLDGKGLGDGADRQALGLFEALRQDRSRSTLRSRSVPERLGRRRREPRSCRRTARACVADERRPPRRHNSRRW